VGGVLVAYSRRRWVRVLGALYPAFMLFDIVATGNHFFFDAATGALVVAIAWWAARVIVRDSQPSQRFHAVTA
jgi:hypothetical protein